MPRIVLADEHILPIPHSLGLDQWESRGAQVASPNCRTEDDLIRDCRDAHVIVYFGNNLPLTARVLEQLPECRLIQRVAIGFDSVDVDAATRLGIIVSNSAGYCTEEVANHALALLLACHQQIPRRQADLQAGRWHQIYDRPTERLSLLTVGIVGLGRIGSAFCRRIRPLVNRVLVSDPYLDPGGITAQGAEPVDLDTLLAESDLVSLHCPLTTETRGLIDADALARMKPSACLINTARGPVVDQTALNEALVDGRIRGAGLDVFETEPPPTPLHDLFTHPHVVVTPHCAASSPSSREDLWRIATGSVTAVLDGCVPDTIVNPTVTPRPLATLG